MLHNDTHDDGWADPFAPSDGLGPAPKATSPAGANPNAQAWDDEVLLQHKGVQGDEEAGATDNWTPGTASTASSIFNLANTIIGTGVLTMSWVLAQSGLIGFILMIAGMGYLSDMAVVTLFRAMKLLRRRDTNYGGLGKLTFGKLGELTASWSVTIQQLGAGAAYVTIIADVLVPVLELSGSSLLGSRAFVQLMVATFVILPLCMLPSMKALSGASLASLMSILSFILVLFVCSMYTMANIERRDELAKPGEPIDGDFQVAPPGAGLIRGFPLIAFAYLCHQNSFPIYRELRNASIPKMQRVSSVSMTICGLGYIICGISGYLLFLNRTESDLLNNFQTEGTYLSMPINVVRVMFGISTMLSYPVLVFEARTNIDKLIFGEGRPWEFKRALILNLGIVSLTTFIGIVVPGIHTVLGLVGSTCSPLMAFILPASFYLKSMHMAGIDVNLRHLVFGRPAAASPRADVLNLQDADDSGHGFHNLSPSVAEDQSLVVAGGIDSPHRDNPLVLNKALQWDDTASVRYRLWQAYLLLAVGIVLIPLCLTMWFIDEVA